MEVQEGWFRCFKCDGLVFGQGESRGVCPVDNRPHEVSVSTGMYVVPFGNAHAGAHAGELRGRPERQGDWRWCHKCQGMFFAGNANDQGFCPAAFIPSFARDPRDVRRFGPHDGSRSGHYAIMFDDGSVTFEQHWRWCRKCQALFHGSRPSLLGPIPGGGICPATPERDRFGHDGSKSGKYQLEPDPNQ